MTTNYRLILRDIINEYYSKFKEKSRKCIWLSAFAPSEIIKSFNLDVFYPESYAVVLSIRKNSSELFDIARSLGFDDNICSYMRLFFAALDYDKRLPYGKIPIPDGLVVSNNQCGTLLLMWKLLAIKFKVPLFVIDMPPDKGLNKSTKYVSAQLKSLIHFLENISREQFNFSKLRENLNYSTKNSELWLKLCEMVFQEKSAISIQTLTTNLFFPIVSARSDLKTNNFLKAALEKLSINNQPNSKNIKKIFWWGYPLWFLNDKFLNLNKYKAKIIANNYLLWWYIPINTKGDLIKNLAKSYVNTYLNRDLSYKILQFEEAMKKYKIDGVIVHINSSCKRDSIISTKIVKILKEKNIPTVAIEADMCDKNKFQIEKTFSIIETLLENI